MADEKNNLPKICPINPNSKEIQQVLQNKEQSPCAEPVEPKELLRMVKHLGTAWAKPPSGG